MKFKYLIFNAPSSHTIERAASLGCNWALVHSAGIEGRMVHESSGREMDAFPLYFEDYPKVASVRRQSDAAWLEPLRRDVRALCERADSLGLRVAFHMYEPTLPHIFEREYPETVSVYHRPTQAGTQYIHSHVDPDNPATWELVRSKYAELAREFPLMRMVILTTWDGSGSRWCLPEAKMPRWKRLVGMIEAAREGVRSVRSDVTVVLRLWGRNWPREIYTRSHAEIARLTGVGNADDLMEPVCRPYNDPEEILPRVFKALPADVPVMYKSTQMDIADGQPIAECIGKYPQEREQILEVSYELYHRKPWPWCKVAHIRNGLEAARRHKLAGVLALPLNMGNNDRDCRPEEGNLGRMNTWILERLLAEDPRGDEELVAAWLEKEFGSKQPAEAARALVEADSIVDRGIQWGGGVVARMPLASLHTTKLCWLFDGYIDPAFPGKMADPTLETIEDLIRMKHSAHEEARAQLARIESARAVMSPKLHKELSGGYQKLADYAMLCRDWHSHLLMQYALERGLLEPSRVSLGRMSRYCESFISNLADLRDKPAGKMAMSRISFPDPFGLT